MLQIITPAADGPRAQIVNSGEELPEEDAVKPPAHNTHSSHLHLPRGQTSSASGPEVSFGRVSVQASSNATSKMRNPQRKKL